jgi:hypothetical protein
MALSTEKVTYRGYAKFNEAGEVTSLNAKAESAGQVSWKKLEEAKATKLNENEFIRYTINSIEDFKALVPDEQQLIYIAQAGLNYVQNAKANGYMLEMLEDAAAPNTPKYDGQTIDLREAINDPPSKRSLTDNQKLIKLLKSTGLDAAGIAALLGEAAKAFSEEPGEVSATEVGVEETGVVA